MFYKLSYELKELHLVYDSGPSYFYAPIFSKKNSDLSIRNSIMSISLGEICRRDIYASPHTFEAKTL